MKSRVNFLKYHKPEKDVSFIKNSAVYKLIHGLDGQPNCGISNRPEKVAAEDDIKRVCEKNFSQSQYKLWLFCFISVCNTMSVIISNSKIFFTSLYILFYTSIQS